MTEGTRDGIQETMRICFGDPTIVVGPHTTADDLDGWDSLGHARLILALETRFGMRFPAERLFDLNSVAELAQIIEAGGREG